HTLLFCFQNASNFESISAYTKIRTLSQNSKGKFQNSVVGNVGGADHSYITVTEPLATFNKSYSPLSSAAYR
ncbi:hypothetical protein, partial [Halomicronema sp. CCY15110]|uniref:hypothetical protein n=1 Tax=Halomicronema sp. CCY15110 TaxID=2767773 RepID=UPI00194E8FCF